MSATILPHVQSAHPAHLMLVTRQSQAGQCERTAHVGGSPHPLSGPTPTPFVLARSQAPVTVLHTPSISRPPWTPIRAGRTSPSAAPRGFMRPIVRVLPAMERNAYRECRSQTTSEAGGGFCVLAVPASRPSGTTVPACPRVPNIHAIPVLGVPAMAQTSHPLDIATDNLGGTVRRLMVRAFLQPDAEGQRRIDPPECAALDAHVAETGNVIAYRRREVAADSFKRNGDSRVTRDAFRDAGHGLVDLTAERNVRRSNVIAFPAPDTRDAG